MSSDQARKEPSARWRPSVAPRSKAASTVERRLQRERQRAAFGERAQPAVFAAAEEAELDLEVAPRDEQAHAARVERDRRDIVAGRDLVRLPDREHRPRRGDEARRQLQVQANPRLRRFRHQRERRGIEAPPRRPRDRPRGWPIRARRRRRDRAAPRATPARADGRAGARRSRSGCPRAKDGGRRSRARAGGRTLRRRGARPRGRPRRAQRPGSRTGCCDRPGAVARRRRRATAAAARRRRTRRRHAAARR